MPQSTRYRAPTSVKEVKKILTVWQWPLPSDEALKLLCTTLPQEVKSAFEVAINKDTGHEAKTKYLKGLVGALMDSTLQGIAALGYAEPALPKLIELGIQHGTALTGAVIKATSGGDDAAAARKFLNDILPPEWRNQPGAQNESRTHSAASTDHAPPAPEEEPAARAQDERADAPSPAGQREQREYHQTHVYASKVALCFSSDVTKSSDASRPGKHTVRLEAAEAKGPKDYEWQKKISVQFSIKELPMVLAVLMGWVSKFEAKGHGAANEKWVVIERQQGKLWIAVNAKGMAGRGAPAQAGEIYPIVTLLLRQMLKNDSHLTVPVILQVTKAAAELANSASAAKE